MNAQVTIFLVVILGVSAVAAEDASPSPKLFAVSYSLRSSAPASFIPVAEPLPEVILTSSRLRETPIELATQRYEAMNGRPLLVRPEPQLDPGGAYGVLKKTVFDPITHPEVVKVGKAQITGGIVGALKKKNPFYLLNPLVFALDW
jgi:hypothetical protein